MAEPRRRVTELSQAADRKGLSGALLADENELVARLEPVLEAVRRPLARVEPRP